MISEKLAKLVVNEQGLDSAAEELRRGQATFIRRCLSMASDMASNAGLSFMAMFHDPFAFGYKEGLVQTKYVDAGKDLEDVIKAVNRTVEGGQVEVGWVVIRKPPITEPAIGEVLRLGDLL